MKGSHREFEWDDTKSATNLRNRGFGFDAVIAVFLDPGRLDGIDATRVGDGEARTKVIGLIEGKLFTIVYTMRADVTRIISARRANDKEIRAHGHR